MVNEPTWKINDNDNELRCVAIVAQCVAQWCMLMLLHNTTITYYYALLPLHYYMLSLLHNCSSFFHDTKSGEHK